MKKIYSALFCILFSAYSIGQVCTGAPAANTTIASSTLICSGGTTTLSLLNTYTNTGLAYQWLYSAASPVGPWTPLNGVNNAALISNTLTGGYYTAVIVCTPALASTTATPVYLAQGSINATTTVPYFESFENYSSNGLPNCSWSATSLGVNCIVCKGAASNPPAVPYSGSVMPAFSYSASNTGTESFYSMGIQLYASVVYSGSVAYSTNNYLSPNNWSNFGLAVGPSQSAAGGTVFYSVNNPANGPYSIGSGTFTVPASGLYYIRIFAGSVPGTNISQYLSFDNLIITAPCTVPVNSGSVTVALSSQTVCANSPLTVTMTAAPNTTFVGGPVLTMTMMPTQSFDLTVTGTNTLTGCISVNGTFIVVNPAPIITGVSSPPSICFSSSSALHVFGSTNATLFPGPVISNTGSFVVTPSVTSIYTIVASAINGCIKPSTVMVTVLPLPQLTLMPSQATVCAGESFTFSAAGAANYTVQNKMFLNQASLTPAFTSSSYPVVGTSTAGCENTTTLDLTVDACSGLREWQGSYALQVFPQPADKYLLINITAGTRIILSEVNGKIVQDIVSDKNETTINLEQLPGGIYFLKAQNAGAVTTRKILITHQ